MRILLDECVPKPLKSKFSVEGHLCSTTPEVGLSGLTNGKLLRKAERQFDVLVTVDKGIQYQQNLMGHHIAVLLIRAKSNRAADILPHLPACLVALRTIKSGQVLQVGEKQ